MGRAERGGHRGWLYPRRAGILTLQRRIGGRRRWVRVSSRSSRLQVSHLRHLACVRSRLRPAVAMAMRTVGKTQRVGGAAVWLIAAALAAAVVTEATGQSQPPGAAAAPQANSVPGPAGAADAAPAPPQPPVSASSFPPQPPPPTVKRGFLNDLGNWWDNSFSNLGTRIDEARGKFVDINKKSNDAAKNAAIATQQAVKNAAATTQQAVTSAATATKDAATAIVRLPATSVLESARALRAGAERRAGLPGGGDQCLSRQGLCQGPAARYSFVSDLPAQGRAVGTGAGGRRVQGRDGGAARLLPIGAARLFVSPQPAPASNLSRPNNQQSNNQRGAPFPS